jgi:hypothetical protein
MRPLAFDIPSKIVREHHPNSEFRALSVRCRKLLEDPPNLEIEPCMAIVTDCTGD